MYVQGCAEVMIGTTVGGLNLAAFLSTQMELRKCMRHKSVKHMCTVQFPFTFRHPQSSNNNTILKGLGNGGAGPGPETASLFRGRRISSGAQRRRSWPGLEGGGSSQSSETVGLFRGSESAKLAGVRRRRSGPGARRRRRRRISSGAQRLWSWPGLEDGELARAYRRRNWPEPETAKLAGARRRRNWSGIGDMRAVKV